VLHGTSKTMQAEVCVRYLQFMVIQRLARLIMKQWLEKLSSLTVGLRQTKH